MKKTTWPTLLISSGLFLFPQLSHAETSAADFITLSGATTGEAVGQTVAVGDFNGDGFMDVVTGAPNGSTNYIAIIYGQSSQLVDQALSTSEHTIITGSSSADLLGSSLATGDINLDGYDDIVVGAPGDAGSGTNSGAVFIVYGKTAQLSSGSVSSTSEIVKFNGDQSSSTGQSVGLGDVNGDGYLDLVVGATGGHSGPTLSTGAVYVIYGSSTPFSGQNNYFVSQPRFVGEATNDSFGQTVAAGDFNGDAYADIAVGAPGNDDGGSGAGAAYVIWGQAAQFTGTLNAATNYLQLNGENAGDAAGSALAISSTSILDDSYNELIVTSPGSDRTVTDGGAVYVFSGSAGSETVNTDVSVATSIFTGEEESAGVGDAVATADFNQDGADDLLIGAKTTDSNTGSVYQINGSVSLASSGLSLATNTFVGESAGDMFGQAVAGGDLNGDDYPEVVVGGSGYSTGNSSGAVQIGYLFSQVELGKDSLDNDGDGSVDEVNTVAENGAHPVYSSLDPADTATTQQNIESVEGTTSGAILVTYADTSVYKYTIFSTTSTKLTKVKRYNRTGYAVALQKKGKKIVLVNLYSGDKPSSKKLLKKPANTAAFKLADVRQDGKKEAVVTTKRKAKVKVFLVKVNKTQGKLSLKDSTLVISKKVAVKKTRVKKSTVQLRNSSGKVLFRLKVNKQYQFIEA